jgi:hypothetical protein
MRATEFFFNQRIAHHSKSTLLHLRKKLIPMLFRLCCYHNDVSCMHVSGTRTRTVNNVTPTALSVYKSHKFIIRAQYYINKNEMIIYVYVFFCYSEKTANSAPVSPSKTPGSLNLSGPGQIRRYIFIFLTININNIFRSRNLSSHFM